jgi:hypothetical protein
MAKSVKSSSIHATDLGSLPTWDLSDLYPGPDSDALGGDLRVGGKGLSRTI